ncbi:serine/threonine protein kinase, partial [Streptomyces lunaelactis]|nr:serine/threonine protein kinase [Streptomyces lunaelactis]
MPVVAAVITVALAVTAGAVLVLALRNPDNGDGNSSAGKGRSSGSSPAPTPTGTTSPSPTPTPTPTPSPTPPAGNPTTDIWVAQLASVSKSAGTAARDRQERVLRNQGLSNVGYVDSGEYASLRAGYWMFYVPGFDNGAAAVTWCRTNGLSTK